MAHYRKEVTRALDECLDRILVNGESIEQCLQSYPALVSELEPLLKTALMTHQAAALTPRPEFRERARFQFQAALRDMAIKKEERRGFTFGWQPRFATLVISIILTVVVLGSGTVAAAGNSLPDSPLYPVKLAKETVQLKLADTPLEKAALHSKFADNRVTELVKMAEKGKVDQVEKLASRLNTELVAMTLAAKANGEGSQLAAGEAAPMLQAPTTAPAPTQEVSIAAVPEPTPEAPPTAAPAPVAPRPTPTLTVKPTPAPAPAPAPRKVAPTAAAPAPVAPKAVDKNSVAIAPAPRAPQSLTAEQLVKLEKRAQLKAILKLKADANPEAIRKALENAPESVKAALYQALTVADSGYQQALNALGN